MLLLTKPLPAQTQDELREAAHGLEAAYRATGDTSFLRALGQVEDEMIRRLSTRPNPYDAADVNGAIHAEKVSR